MTSRSDDGPSNEIELCRRPLEDRRLRHPAEVSIDVACGRLGASGTMHTVDERPDAHSIGYVFVSYDRANADYVERLVAHLKSHDVRVWVDEDDVPVGARLRRVIRDAIDGCAAFLVVMTPQAENSDWVDDELQRARERNKPIFPLLVSGSAFFGIGATSYEDVSDGSMPSDRFVAALPRTGGAHDDAERGAVSLAGEHTDDASVTKSHSEPKRGIFVMYSHVDNPTWIELVRGYLQPLTSLGYEVWDDSLIEPGALWREEIGAELSKAQIVVLLVTQNFENSEFIRYDELGPALANAYGGVQVFAIGVEYVAHDVEPLKSLLLPYQWVYGPPNDRTPPLDALDSQQTRKVLIHIRRALETALVADNERRQQ